MDQIELLAASQPPPMLNVVSPLNDAQLICLIAAQRPDEPAKAAVSWAIELVAEAVARQQEIGAKLQARGLVKRGQIVQ